MELPFTITQMFYGWLALTLITNTWLIIWVYGNWKAYVQKSVKTLEKYGDVDLVPKESYDDLDQDEKDFWGIK